MNTTKDECDGWINSKSDYKPAHCNPVLVYTRGPSLEVARWSEVSNVWTGPSSDFSDDFVTHWHELPEPPKSKNAFETWWNTLAPAEALGQEFRYAFKNHGMLFKPTAKLVWKAAINSTKQC